MTTRGHSAYESSAAIKEEDLSEAQGREEAKACQGILTSQGLDHVQVWHPFEPMGDIPKAPNVPAAVHLKENQRKFPSALPQWSLASESEAADLRKLPPAALPQLSLASDFDLRLCARNVNMAPSVPTPRAKVPLHDPGQPSRSVILPTTTTKQGMLRETRPEKPRGIPRKSSRQSDLLRRRPGFGKTELGVDCTRSLSTAGRQRTRSQPLSVANRAATKHSGDAAPAAAIFIGTGVLRA